MATAERCSIICQIVYEEHSSIFTSQMIRISAQAGDWRRNPMNKTSQNVNLMNSINKKATK